MTKSGSAPLTLPLLRGWRKALFRVRVCVGGGLQTELRTKHRPKTKYSIVKYSTKGNENKISKALDIGEAEGEGVRR